MFSVVGIVGSSVVVKLTSWATYTWYDVIPGCGSHESTGVVGVPSQRSAAQLSPSSSPDPVTEILRPVTGW